MSGTIKFYSKGEDEIGGRESELSLDSIVPEMIKNLTFQLKGHEDLKKDFSFNLKKFALLNKMKQRKIFSVFLLENLVLEKQNLQKPYQRLCIQVRHLSK